MNSTRLSTRSRAIAILFALGATSCVIVGTDGHARHAHAQAHSCQPKAVGVTRPVPNVAVTEGCGSKDAFFHHAHSGVLWDNAVNGLLTRVRYQTECSDLEWRVLSGSSVGVRGCGQSLVYISTVHGWVLDESTRS